MNPTTILLAQLLAPLYILLGLRFLTQPGEARAWLADLRHVGELYLWGALLVFGGTAVILHHNFWVASPAVLITILGWGATLKGAALLLFPRQFLALAEFFLNSLWLRLAGAVALLFGAVLAWLGYFAVV